ncbi:MAG: hypothetical protein ABL984_08995 [Pyrinomonadaceae bacterium]
MLIAFLLFIYAFVPESESVGMRKPAGCDFFTRENATRILGGDVTWTGTDATDSEPKKWTCTFVSKEVADGPKIYFALHRFTSADTARGEFDTIVQSNKNNAGFEKWQGVGDDAIVHSDGSNFQFVMVRKGIRSFRIKVNPAGSTSLENVKQVAESLVRKIEEMGGGE